MYCRWVLIRIKPELKSRLPIGQTYILANRRIWLVLGILLLLLSQVVRESCCVVSESFIERGSATEENALHTFCPPKRVARHRGAGLTSQRSAVALIRGPRELMQLRVWRSFMELKSNNIGEPLLLLLCMPATYLVKALCRLQHTRCYQAFRRAIDCTSGKFPVIRLSQHLHISCVWVSFWMYL